VRPCFKAPTTKTTTLDPEEEEQAEDEDSSASAAPTRSSKVVDSPDDDGEESSLAPAKSKSKVAFKAPAPTKSGKTSTYETAGGGEEPAEEEVGTSEKCSSTTFWPLLLTPRNK